jgi:hypothetical protein
MPEARIAGYGTALPWPIPTARFLEVNAEARQVLGQGEGTRPTVRQLALGSRIRAAGRPTKLVRDGSVKSYRRAAEVP